MAANLLVQSFLQRLIEQEIEIRFRHRGVFLSKLSQKGWTGSRDVPFTRPSRSLKGLVMQCRSFIGRQTASSIGSPIAI